MEVRLSTARRGPRGAGRLRAHDRFARRRRTAAVPPRRKTFSGFYELVVADGELGWCGPKARWPEGERALREKFGDDPKGLAPQRSPVRLKAPRLARIARWWV